ncbi:MAG: hypothetical protein QW156_04240 [Candidatus Aenigmatarchaeota archaeon]
MNNKPYLNNIRVASTIIILFSLIIFPSFSFSQTTYKAKIAKYPITIEEFKKEDNNKIIGRYKYDRVGKWLKLEGKIPTSSNRVIINEYDENNRNTGYFIGILSKDKTNIKLLSWIDKIKKNRRLKVYSPLIRLSEKKDDINKCPRDFLGSFSSCVLDIALKKKDIEICKKANLASCFVAFPKALKFAQTHSENWEEALYECSLGYLDLIAYYDEKNEFEKANEYSKQYDNGENDYPPDIAPKSLFIHSLSIPFNKEKSVLRVYIDQAYFDQKEARWTSALSVVRLVKYSFLTKTSELLGDIRGEFKANSQGIFIPIAISKDDNNIILEAHMGHPGLGGGCTYYGYSFLPLSNLSQHQDKCGYLLPIRIEREAFFYDGYSKALYYSEEYYLDSIDDWYYFHPSAINFIDITSRKTKKLLMEPDTIYEIIKIDEESKTVTFKSCKLGDNPDRLRSGCTFSCPDSDPTTKVRTMNLP